MGHDYTKFKINNKSWAYRYNIIVPTFYYISTPASEQCITIFNVIKYDQN